MQRTVGAAFAFTFLLCAPLTAQTIIIEAEAGADAFLFCQWYHVPVTCEEKHFEGDGSPSVGAMVKLSGRSYIVEWIGPGYHLASGVILQPVGTEAVDLIGQIWLEVYPEEGRIHTSSGWSDMDGNRALSVSDALALGSGPALTVKDVRLQLRARPVPGVP